MHDFPHLKNYCMQTNPRAPAVRSHRWLYGVLALNVAMLVCYIFFAYKSEFHSDDSVANLLAQEIAETGEWFPSDWNYVNGDLWVFFTHSWIVPLLRFFPNGFELRAATGLIGATLILCASWVACAILDMSKLARLIALALLAGGISTNMASNLFGQQAYGMMYYMACFMLYSGWACMTARGRTRLGWALASAVVVFLEAWANPQRAAIYYLIPLASGCAAAYALRWQQPAEPTRTPVHAHVSGPAIVWLIAAVIAAAAVGSMLHGMTLNKSHSVQPPALSPSWLGYDDMTRNANLAFRNLVSLTGGFPKGGATVANAAGVTAAMRLLAALTLVLLMPWALIQTVRTRHPARVFFAAASLGSIALSLFIFVTTSVVDVSVPEAPARYLVPGLVNMLLVFVYVVADRRTAGAAPRMAAGIAIAVLTITSPISLSLVDLPKRLAQGGLDATNDRMRLISWLKSSNLRYGYASFWNAGQLTVLSNQETKIRQILIVDKLPVPMHHLSSDRWYDAAAFTGPTFMLLTPDEAQQIDWQAMAQRTRQQVKFMTFEGWKIAVFDHNIAKDFPSWGLRISAPVDYPSLPETGHLIGRPVNDPPGLMAAKNEAGILSFGPYRRLPAGPYRASFKLRTQGAAGQNFGHVDVAAEDRVLANGQIDQTGDQIVTVHFVLDHFTRGLEFRVFSTGAGELAIYNIQLASDEK
jgi:hypothetical protein